VRQREQGLTLFTAILWLVGIVVVIQLWLVAAALEALLAGHRSVLIPAALASLVLLGANGGLLLFVVRLDRRIRGQAGPPE
jgi:hypothetical protein